MPINMEYLLCSMEPHFLAGGNTIYPNHMGSEAALVSENLVFSQDFANKEAYTNTMLPLHGMQFQQWTSDRIL